MFGFFFLKLRDCSLLYRLDNVKIGAYSHYAKEGQSVQRISKSTFNYFVAKAVCLFIQNES